MYILAVWTSDCLSFNSYTRINILHCCSRFYHSRSS